MAERWARGGGPERQRSDITFQDKSQPLKTSPAETEAAERVQPFERDTSLTPIIAPDLPYFNVFQFNLIFHPWYNSSTGITQLLKFDGFIFLPPVNYSAAIPDVIVSPLDSLRTIRWLARRDKGRNEPPLVFLLWSVNRNQRLTPTQVRFDQLAPIRPCGTQDLLDFRFPGIFKEIPRYVWRCRYRGKGRSKAGSKLGCPDRRLLERWWKRLTPVYQRYNRVQGTCKYVSLTLHARGRVERPDECPGLQTSVETIEKLAQGHAPRNYIQAAAEFLVSYAAALALSGCSLRTVGCGAGTTVIIRGDPHAHTPLFVNKLREYYRADFSQTARPPPPPAHPLCTPPRPRNLGRLLELVEIHKQHARKSLSNWLTSAD